MSSLWVALILGPRGTQASQGSDLVSGTLQCGTQMWHQEAPRGCSAPYWHRDSPGHPGGSSTVHNSLSGNHLAAFLLSLWTGCQMNSNFWLSPTKPPLTELSSFSVLLVGQWLTFGRTCGDRLAEGRLTLKAEPHSRASPNSFLSLSCRMVGQREFLNVLLSVHSYLIRRRFPVLRLAFEVSLSSSVAKGSLSPSTPALFFFCKDCSHLRLWFFFYFFLPQSSLQLLHTPYFSHRSSLSFTPLAPDSLVYDRQPTANLRLSHRHPPQRVAAPIL